MKGQVSACNDKHAPPVKTFVGAAGAILVAMRYREILRYRLLIFYPWQTSRRANHMCVAHVTKEGLEEWLAIERISW